LRIAVLKIVGNLGKKAVKLAAVTRSEALGFSYASRSLLEIDIE
jgi:hypothetical protein